MSEQELLEYQFKKLANDEDWESVSELLYEISQYDPKEEIRLSYLLTDEQSQELKRWDRKVNGSVEVQMDDNS